MQVTDLKKFFENAKNSRIGFKGLCHDCGVDVVVDLDMAADDKLTIDGGAIYYPQVGETSVDKKLFLKCNSCFEKDPTLRKYQPCEIYSRAIGYLRPISQWNEGKQAEYELRNTFTIDG